MCKLNAQNIFEDFKQHRKKSSNLLEIVYISAYIIGVKS
jgi:hypothetical protein